MDYFDELDEYGGGSDTAAGFDYYDELDGYGIADTEETEYHVMGGLKSALYRGARALGGNLPAAIGIVIPGDDPLEKMGRENKAVYDDMMLKSKDVQEFNQAVSGGRESIWTEALGSAGETGAALLTSTIPVVGRAMAGGMFLDLNKEEIYEMAKQKGVDEDTAQLTSWVGGAVNSALDMFGITRGPLSALVGAPAKNITNFMLGVARSAFYEGSTEAVQEFVSELASEVGAMQQGETQDGYWTRIGAKMPEIWDRMKHAGAIGGIMGGGFHAVGSGGQAIKPLQEPKWETLNSIEANPEVTPEKIDELIKSGYGANEGITKQELNEIKKRKIQKARDVGPQIIQQTAVTDAERTNLNEFEAAIIEQEKMDEDAQQFMAAVGEETELERKEFREGMFEEAGINTSLMEPEPEMEPILPVPSEMEEEANIAMEVEEEYQQIKRAEAQEKADEVETKFTEREKPVEPTPGGGVLSKATDAVGGRVDTAVERERMGKAGPKEVKARQKLVWEQKKTPMVEEHGKTIEGLSARDIKSVRKEELVDFAEEMNVKSTGTKSEILTRIKSEVKKERTRHEKRIRSAVHGLSTAVGKREEGAEKVSKTVEPETPGVTVEEETQPAPKKATEQPVKEKFPKREPYTERFPGRKPRSLLNIKKKKDWEVAEEKMQDDLAKKSPAFKEILEYDRKRGKTRTPKSRTRNALIIFNQIYKGDVKAFEKDVKSNEFYKLPEGKPQTKLAVGKAVYKPKTEHLRYDGTVDLGDGVMREQWTLTGLPEKEMSVPGLKQKIVSGGTYMDRGTLKKAGFTNKQMEEVKAKGKHEKGAAPSEKYQAEFDKTTVTTEAIRKETGEVVKISQTAKSAMADVSSRLSILNELKGCLSW